MTIFRIILTLLSLVIIPKVLAVTISDVNVPENVQVNGQQLVLNGAGVRDKFFIDLYVGSLYLSQKSQTMDSILTQPLSMIRLNITSSLITKDKMQEAIGEGFEKATNGNTKPLLSKINLFMNLFSQKIDKDDQFSFIFKTETVECYKNGKLLSTINNEAFKEALMSIWLGKHPTQQNLKEDMLH